MSVWYSPELDELQLAHRDQGFLFKDEIVECLVYKYRHISGVVTDFKITKFYFIGEL